MYLQGPVPELCTGNWPRPRVGQRGHLGWRRPGPAAVATSQASTLRPRLHPETLASGDHFHIVPALEHRALLPPPGRQGTRELQAGGSSVAGVSKQWLVWGLQLSLGQHLPSVRCSVGTPTRVTLHIYLISGDFQCLGHHINQIYFLQITFGTHNKVPRPFQRFEGTKLQRKVRLNERKTPLMIEKWKG